MQPPFSCVPPTFRQIEKAIAPARLSRYIGTVDGDKNLALRLYIWNIRLCEALYLPTQFCEVSLRNAIHNAVSGKHGQNWYERGSFRCTLPRRLADELQAVINSEKAVYGAHMTVNHIISGLTFGFWLHLLTKTYEGVFWPDYFSCSFPGKPAHIGRQAVYDMADRFRVHRNRIAHHKPVFDQSPNSEYANMLQLISWICPETRWLVRSLATVNQVINARPKV
ncbi:MAG: Abi family protein [Alphaproteobacteria bacterium]|nr:Abi family protein [Alphaproteobacteria bacterium]